jgi:LuxR family maltose regulon positive regulatory protein
MRKNVNQQNKYYFSDRLIRQLKKISHHPLTVVEAPSGFGKTTAVREYLKDNIPHGDCLYWYTCLGESATMAWIGICEQFTNMNIKVSNDLKNIKMPSIDTLFYITTYLRELHCQTKTYIVVDNYQLFNCDIPRELIDAFSLHGNPKLHMIFITQPLETNKNISIHNNHIYTIDAASFLYDKDDTACLLRTEGIRLDDNELEKIFIRTEGWVSAIRLQMKNYLETGSFDLVSDIEQLVEKTIWNRLMMEEKDFLLQVSVLDSFTMRQAAIIMNQEILSEKIEGLLKNNDFIKYLPDKSRYSMHSILRDYLRNRFYYQMPEEYQNQVFCKAGVSCAAMSQYYPAAEFFYKIRNFEAILSLPFSRDYLDKWRGKKPSEFIATIVNECPENILCKYPFNIIVFGYYFFSYGQTETYQKLCGLLRLVVQNEVYFCQEDMRRLKGEYSILAALGDFNDQSKTQKEWETAIKILGKPSTITNSGFPWLFATTSVLNMLWREAGDLENELQLIDIGAKLYYQLRRGHGKGHNSVMRAEAMFMRGEDCDAEILCHKALYEARSYQQTDICICAELVLARIAILRGEVDDYFIVINNLKDYAKNDSNLYVLHMVEYCMSIIGFELDLKCNVAPWLYNLDSIKNVLYAPVIPHAQVLYLNLLLLENRYNELYGISQHILDTSRNLNGSMKFIMPQVYCYMFLAIAKYNNGDRIEAEESLKQALSLALTDRIYYPFASEFGRLNYLLGSLKNSIADKDGINAIIELGKRYERGKKIIKKAITSDRSPLTPREREVAQLARDRLSAKEIAVRLFISETTVRTILRNVYSKLDIHSKAELANKHL